jgi:bacteriocin-like protein
MKEMDKNELILIVGGESFWLKVTRAIGYAVGECADAIESYSNNYEAYGIWNGS